MPFRLPLRTGLFATFVGCVFLLVRCLPSLHTNPPFPVRSEKVCGDGVLDPGDGGEQCDAIDGGAIGCFATCRINCAGGAFDELTGSCYLARGVSTSFREAVQRCEREEAHLVTIGSLREQDFVRTHLNPGDLWVGLSVDPKLAGFTSVATTEPGWTEQCPGCFAPNVLDASQQCVTQTQNVWVSRSFTSDAPLDVVCERERPGISSEGCSDGVCVHPFASKRYVFFTDEQTAEQAVQTCVNYGGQLVMFDTEQEREYVSRELRTLILGFGYQFGTADAGDPGVWLGLSRRADQWLWIDDAGFDARPNPWGDGQPLESDAGYGGAAFTYIADEQIDTQLARTSRVGDRKPYLCEFR